VSPSEKITLASVLVAALGIAATVFTQIWQSRQEERREARAAAERQAERWLNNNRDLYMALLASTDEIEAIIGQRFFLVAHRDYDSLRLPPPDVPADGRRRDLGDLLDEVELLAPAAVAAAAKDYVNELRSLEWSTAVWSAQDDPAADSHATASNEEAAESCRAARSTLREAMKADLRGPGTALHPPTS
jgi:hypothetical protein